MTKKAWSKPTLRPASTFTDQELGTLIAALRVVLRETAARSASDEAPRLAAALASLERQRHLERRAADRDDTAANVERLAGNSVRQG